MAKKAMARLTVRVRGGESHEPYLAKVAGEWRAYLVKPWGQTLGWYASGTTQIEAVERLQERIDSVIERIENPLEGLGD